jgi:lipid II isoglutaminyl synthase (glutamine-hydrolysing)
MYMNSRRSSTLLAGKALRSLSRLHGGGSALPGLIVEKIDPHFLKNALQHLPYGVVVISGTNGKTTTTKLVVALLESQGLRVFTNPTGSNFKRGILSAIIEKSRFRGKLEYDIAVLELDEAHGALFVRDIAPRYSLLLNVMRDQLDRFGEIDSTTRMLEIIATATTEGIILNAEDARISSIASKISDKTVRFFGLSDRTRSHFPDDDGLYAQADTPPILSVRPREIDVMLEDFIDQSATFTIGDERVTANLKLTGAYNLFNAAAAIALVRLVCKERLDKAKLITALSLVEPAFGRGERLIVGGASLDLLLVKNPSGFRLSLGSFPADAGDTMIAINDNYADGRDMSWLWDVDFSSLAQHGVAALSGTRAYDMALRLQYDKVEAKMVEPSLQKALKHFLQSSDQPKRIFCTYTAMLTIRKQLKKYTAVERAL